MPAVFQFTQGVNARNMTSKNIFKAPWTHPLPIPQVTACIPSAPLQLIQYFILMCPDIIKCIQNMPNISRYILSKLTGFI